MNFFIFNPHEKPVEDLPYIFGFINGWMAGPVAQALTEDGHGIGSHACSHESYCPGDLGFYEGQRDDRKVYYQKHYPEGYQTLWLSEDDERTCTRFQIALEKAKKIYAENQDA